MPRMIDWQCTCGRVEPDCLEDVDAARACPDCGAPMQQNWLPRLHHDAQWDDRTAVLVHVHPATGDVRYVGSHQAHLKTGYERVYLRSLREVEHFEKAHNVRSEMAWFDKGSGRGFDDYVSGRKETH